MGPQILTVQSSEAEASMEGYTGFQLTQFTVRVCPVRVTMGSSSRTCQMYTWNGMENDAQLVHKSNLYNFLNQYSTPGNFPIISSSSVIYQSYHHLRTAPELYSYHYSSHSSFKAVRSLCIQGGLKHFKFRRNYTLNCNKSIIILYPFGIR